MDDLERLRARQDEADDEATRRAGSDDVGAPCVVGKTTTVTTYPTTVGKVFAITPNDVTGAETEGTTGTLTALSGRFFATHVGATLPPNGTTVVCTYVAYRWVFTYGLIAAALWTT